MWLAQLFWKYHPDDRCVSLEPPSKLEDRHTIFSFRVGFPPFWSLLFAPFPLFPGHMLICHCVANSNPPEFAFVRPLAFGDFYPISFQPPDPWFSVRLTFWSHMGPQSYFSWVKQFQIFTKFAVVVSFLVSWYSVQMDRANRKGITWIQGGKILPGIFLWNTVHFLQIWSPLFLPFLWKLFSFFLHVLSGLNLCFAALKPDSLFSLLGFCRDLGICTSSPKHYKKNKFAGTCGTNWSIFITIFLTIFCPPPMTRPSHRVLNKGEFQFYYNFFHHFLSSANPPPSS